MTLGQEFRGWSTALGKDLDRMAEMAVLFAEVNMGGTAIGTGICTDPKYAKTVIRKLANVTGIDVSTASNLIEASSDMGTCFIPRFFGGLKSRYLFFKILHILQNSNLSSRRFHCIFWVAQTPRS